MIRFRIETHRVVDEELVSAIVVACIDADRCELLINGLKRVPTVPEEVTHSNLVEGRVDKELRLSDVLEAGTVEEANVVLTVKGVNAVAGIGEARYLRK